MYTPQAGTRAKDKFKIIRCSVIRMSDFLKGLASILGVSPDETDRYRPQQPSWGVKFFVFRSGGVDMKSVDEGFLPHTIIEQSSYNRSWRRYISQSCPPHRHCWFVASRMPNSTRVLEDGIRGQCWQPEDIHGA
ncbi:uncharacterized protein B0H18DRAFT_1191567 [Fomitopsis serialis]|uniref:uncharacterized protein n=1 Tax=Fomitopsis serialis TaxID=139415 RepID=UPI002008CB2B|nr:uncharacterized protein B0H18DRAFT_1191567 [Neoantrodia serialis]KAH9920635.1 hypothetical protein B0H18DRAFT_1191567 [Neoantrodia serialis]